MRRVVVGFVAAVAVGTSLAVVPAVAAPVDPVCVEAQPGDGWYAVARQFAPEWWPTVGQVERDSFTDYVARANGEANIGAPVYAGRIVCVNPDRIPEVPPSTTTSSSTSTTTLPPSPPPTSSSSTSSTTTSTPATTSPPAPSGFPNASNTGVPAGVTLTAYTGPLTISTAGTVIDGKTISGCLRVTAANVTIRRSRINCSNGYAIQNTTVRPTWLLVEDVEINCGGSHATAIGDKGITVRRTYIHGCENGFDLDGQTLIEDSYITDPFNDDGAHSDGIQVWPGMRDVTVRHNTFEMQGGTSSIIADVNDIDMTIDGNWLSGGSWTLYCALSSGPGGFNVTNNVWPAAERPGPGRTPPPFGPAEGCERATTWTNNRWSDGQPLNR